MPCSTRASAAPRSSPSRTAVCPPLYQAAQASLLVRSDMISFVDSMAAPLSLLNALILALGRRKSEEVSGTFAELERVWSKYSVFGKADDE